MTESKTIEFAKQKRKSELKELTRQIFNANGEIRKNVTLSDLERHAKLVIDEAKARECDDKDLTKEVDILLAEDSNLLYYGFESKGRVHIFFRCKVSPSIRQNEIGEVYPVGKVELLPSGELKNYRGTYLSTEEINSLAKPGKNRLPGAVTILLCSGCNYVGYFKGYYWFYQPCIGQRNEPAKQLTMLRILENNPDAIVAVGSDGDNFKQVSGPALLQIPRLIQQGKLAFCGPMPKTPKRFEHINTINAEPVLNSGRDI